MSLSSKPGQNVLSISVILHYDSHCFGEDQWLSLMVFMISPDFSTNKLTAMIYITEISLKVTFIYLAFQSVDVERT
jgi:hypothetical protein